MPAILAAISAVLARLPAGILAQITAFLSKTAGRTISGVQGVITYARANPINTFLVAEAVTRFATSNDAAEVIEAVRAAGDSKSSASEVAKSALPRLEAVLAKAVTAGDSSRLGLSSTNDDTANDVARLRMGRCLVRAFGSLAAARDVQTALSTLKAEDFSWLVTMRSESFR